MSTLYVDFGSRFIRSAVASVDHVKLLRDSRHRQEFVRPPEIAWVRDQPHLFWAAQDLAETMTVEERVSWRAIPTSLRSERATPVTLLAMAITRLASEYRAEFSVPVATLAVVLPWGAGRAEIETLEQACAVAEVGRLQTAHPALCAAHVAGSREKGTDLVLDIGANGCRAAWVRWTQGSAELDGEWVEQGFSDSAVLAAVEAQLAGTIQAPTAVVRALADRAWRPRGWAPSDLRLVRAPRGALPLALSARGCDDLMRPLTHALTLLLEQATSGKPENANRGDLRLILAGGGCERAGQWIDDHPRWGRLPRFTPGATAGVFGLAPAIAQEPPLAALAVGELGIEVPRTSRSDRAKGPRSALGVDHVPLIADKSSLLAAGRLADSESGRLGAIARIYQQVEEQHWSHSIELPEGFIASIQPWLELSLISACGPATLIELRTHLGETPRRLLLHRETMRVVDSRVQRWLRGLQQV